MEKKLFTTTYINPNICDTMSVKFSKHTVKSLFSKLKTLINDFYL